ncbi:hypothetical protein [Streptomyces kanamyceticus]|uniref:hypothetical protein n=1 Tax=Streptomyces kanamyceticus TaxID=1967 RepID=UPI0037DCEA0C
MLPQDGDVQRAGTAFQEFLDPVLWQGEHEGVGGRGGLLRLTGSGPSVHAADLLRRVYAALPGDHGLDLAEALTSLSQRHHETSVVPGAPDPAAERTRQRDAAAEATALILGLADTLPTGPPADRTRAAALLDRLIGLLLFGAPAPPDPRTLELQALADSATSLRDTLRATT